MYNITFPIIKFNSLFKLFKLVVDNFFELHGTWTSTRLVWKFTQRAPGACSCRSRSM